MTALSKCLLLYSLLPLTEWKRIMKFSLFLLLTIIVSFSTVIGNAYSGDCKPDGKNSEPVIEIRDNDNEVRLTLTKSSVHMSFSTEVLSKINDHLEMEFQKNIGDFTDSRGEFIASPAHYLSESNIDYSIRDIRSVEYKNGELKFRYFNKQPISFEDIYFNNSKVLKNFSENDAEKFASEFYRIKFK